MPIAHVLLLGAAAYLSWRRRKSIVREARVSEAPRIPAHQAALQMFKLLRQKDYLRYGNFR